MSSFRMFLLFSVFTTGCSSSNGALDENDVSLDISRSSNLVDAVQLSSVPERIGFLVVSDISEFRDISALGAFVNWPIENGTDVSVLFGPNAVISGDSCSLTEIEFESDQTLFDNLQDSFELISAGDQITLTSTAGTYGSLDKIEFPENEVGYTSLSDLTFPSPVELTFDIPGDEFPSSTVFTVKPQPIEDFSILPNSEILGSETLFWVPSSQEETLVSIQLIDDNPSPRYTAECLLIDDGEFEFPTSLQTDITGITGEQSGAILLNVSRVLVSFSNVGLTEDVVIYSRSVGLADN